MTERTVTKPDGRRFVREEFRTLEAARSWRNQRERLEIEAGYILLEGTIRRSGHGARYHGQLVVVTPDWLRKRNERRAARKERAHERQ